MVLSRAGRVSALARCQIVLARVSGRGRREKRGSRRPLVGCRAVGSADSAARVVRGTLGKHDILGDKKKWSRAATCTGGGCDEPARASCAGERDSCVGPQTGPRLDDEASEAAIRDRVGSMASKG